jgi:acyl-CoA synthetase (AMP-forming)/AMP-acid ligase II
MMPESRRRLSALRSPALAVLPRLAVALVRMGYLRDPWRLLTVALPLLIRHGAGLDTVLQIAARRFGGRVAVVGRAGEVSHRELWARAVMIARQLDAGADRTRPAARPSRVLILSGPAQHPISAIAGALRAGFDAVPVDASANAAEIDRLIAAQNVVATVGEATQLQSARVRGFGGLLIDTEASADGPERSGRVRGRSGALVLMTSGSTAERRAVPHPRTDSRRLAGQLALFVASGMRNRTATVVLTPLHHGHGLSAVAGGLLSGSALVLGAESTTAEVVEAIVRFRPKTLTLVPTQLARLLRDGAPIELGSGSRIVAGSGPLSPELCAEAIAAWGPVLINCYGSTEMGTLTVARPRELARQAGSVGRPVPGVSLRVVDSAERTVPRGVAGEIVVGAGSLWTKTHDTGLISPDGLLRVTGRSDRTVVSGAENVGLTRVERAIEAHPSVARVDAQGVADAEFGQIVTASVVLAASARLTEAELRSWLAPRLERHEIPKRIVLRS